jgi:chromosome partitioning protein
MGVVSVINYKGGVGKTTLTANLGAELAARGRTVLLVDLDPQASLTFSFYPPSDWDPARTVYAWFKVFLEHRKVLPLKDFVVVPTEVNKLVQGNGGHLDLIASHLGLIDVDLDLSSILGGARFERHSPDYLQVYRLLADALRDEAFGRYDVVLIDCAPNFNLVTRTGLVASDHVLIPARPDHLSTLGIDYLRSRLSRLVEEYNGLAPGDINPEILGVVYTMVQYAGANPITAQQTTMQRLARLEIPMFWQTIRDNKSAVAEAGNRSVPVALLNPKTDAMANLQYEFQTLASEFLAKTRI